MTKKLKKSKKVSLGFLGRVTEEDGFIPSEKNELKKKSGKTYLDSVEHLITVKKIKFATGESVTSEINKSTKELLKKMKISIT